MKIGWGTRIAILYIGFVALIAILVYRSMHENFDLVSEDYYGEEIKYQQVIDAGKNQAALSAPVTLQQEGKQIKIVFPNEFSGVSMKGSVQFYSAVNAAWDKTFDLNIHDKETVVDISNMQPANYTVKLKWTNADKPYYQETTIKIQP